MWNPLPRVTHFRPPFRISLFWLVVGIAASLAVLLGWVYHIATTTTETYVVYRERIDLRDDAARAGSQLLDDIRQLQADVLRLASVGDETDTSKDGSTVSGRLAEVQRFRTDNEREHRLVPERCRYVEAGTLEYGPSKDRPGEGPPASEATEPPGVAVDEILYREAAGDVLLDAVPAAEWARLSRLDQNQVATLSPQSVNVNLRDPSARVEGDGADPVSAASSAGPHWLLYAVCRLRTDDAAVVEDRSAAPAEPGGRSPAMESAASTAEPGRPAPRRFAYVVMTLNPRLKYLYEDPRHLPFLVHGASEEDATGGEYRWMLHPEKGYHFPDPRAAAFGGDLRGSATFDGTGGQLGDEKLVRSALEQVRSRAKTDPRIKRVGIVLEDDLDHLTMRDGHSLYYVQSRKLDGHVDQLAGDRNDRRYRVSELFAQRADLATVKAADLTAEVPQFRLLARTEDDLEKAQAVISAEVGKRLGSGALKWEDAVWLDDYSFHVNSLAYDPSDPNRFLGLLQGVSAEETKHEVAGAVWWLKVMVIGGVTLLVVVAFALGDATHRLDRLSDQARQLSADVDAGAQPAFGAARVGESDAWAERLRAIKEKLQSESRRNDEVGVLGRALAGLLGRLDAAQETLKDANKNLQANVDQKTDRLKRESKAAEAARREAELAKKRLTFFVARVNHEISNPLQIVRDAADELRQNRYDEETAKDLARIRGAAALIELQVEDLDVACRLDDGNRLQADFKIDPDWVDLPALVRDTVDLMSGRAERQKNVLVAEVAPEIARGEVRFHSDVRRVRQLMMNLIGNACKFTHRGKIVVRAKLVGSPTEGMLAIEIEDNGLGMTPDQKARLGRPYERSTGEGNKNGTGLGYCICENLARRLGGALALVRSEPGRGSRFRIELPLRASERTGDTLLPPKPVAAVSPRTNGDGARRLTRSGEGKTVLVVDDDPEIRELIAGHAVRRQFEVHTAATGEEALRKARTLRPDVITLDVLLPGGDLNGWEVLASLKAAPETADIPVVMATISKEKDQGFTLGAADFMSKPIDHEQLAEKLLSLCREGRPGRVLVVEDDREQREAIARRLAGKGWDVDEAADGLEGLIAAGRRKPDVILLDLAMPGINGIELADELSNDPELKDVPIVVLTGRSLSPEEAEHLSSRVQKILRKGSVRTEDVLETLQQAAVRHDGAAVGGGV